MRPVRFLFCLIVAAALADCAGMPGPQLAAEPPAPPPPATLDGIIYGRAPAAVPVEPAVLPAPAPVLPVPAAVLPGPAPGGDLPYTLDTGDRLRVLVFGQEGLSNAYIIDAAGKVTIPLIGAVSARGCTTMQLAHAITDRLRNGFVRESRTWRSILHPGRGARGWPISVCAEHDGGNRSSDRRRLYPARLSL